MGKPARRMLLVDDDVVLRERLARALRSRGLEVQTGGNFEEGLALAQADPPDLAVVDLRMPGRSGLELVRELRSLSDQLRIVVLTAYGSIANAVEALRLGAVHYLSKPADAEDVLAAFERRPDADEGPLPPAAEPRPASLARAEWEHIQRILHDVDGNVSEAARRLGIHRRSLQRKLKKFAPD